MTNNLGILVTVQASLSFTKDINNGLKYLVLIVCVTHNYNLMAFPFHTVFISSLGMEELFPQRKVPPCHQSDSDIKITLSQHSQMHRRSGLHEAYPLTLQRDLKICHQGKRFSRFVQ